MTVTLQRTLKDAGATAAAQLVAPVLNIDGSGVAGLIPLNWSAPFGGTTYYGVGDFPPPLHTTNKGFRKAFSSAQNLTDRQFIQWRLAMQANPDSQKTWANGGGFVMAFYDGSGNFAAYKISGGDAVWSATAEGTSTVFMDFNRGGFNGPSTLDDFRVAFFHLDRTRTPDYSSGVLDWTAVAGYELLVRPNGAGTRMVLMIGQMYTVDGPVVTGVGSLTSAMVDLRTQISSLQGVSNAGCNCFDGVSSFPMFGGAPSALFYSAIGFQVGNGGATTTTGTLDAGTLAFLNPPEDTHQGASPRFYGLQGYFLPGTTSRLIDVYQGASDVHTFNDRVWSSSRCSGVRVRGNTAGTAAFNRNQFIRPSQFECGHGVFTDCLWDAPTAPVKVTLDSEIVRGVIRNGSRGLDIVGGPGNYSAIETSLGGASTYDIEVGSGGAGTYILSNVTATGTLKIHNPSATNAVVLELPAGILYTTSTAGGSLTISTPSVYQSVTVNGLVPGSRVQIYDTAHSELLANEVAAGSTVVWIDANPATSARDIRLRIGHVNGVTSKLFIEAAIGSCGTGESDAGISYLANQEDNDVYNLIGVDGSTVTEVEVDDSTDRIKLLLSGGGGLLGQRIYAFQEWWLTTESGINDDGAVIRAVSAVEFPVSGFRFKNVGTDPIVVYGCWMYDADTGSSYDLIDQTGGTLHMVADRVFPFTTGDGPLTPTQAAALASIKSKTDAFNVVGGLVHADVKANNGTAIKGDGTTGNKWRSTLVA